MNCVDSMNKQCFSLITAADVNVLIELARKAGDQILEIYNKTFDINYKEDKSPLTDADIASNNIIIEGLKKHFPDIPVIAEESKNEPYETRKNWNSFWLVDPLDGTKEFINRNGEFTINIALIINNEPVLGLIFAPVPNLLYYAVKGQGCFKIENAEEPVKITSRKLDYNNKVIITGSRSHSTPELEEYVKQMKQKYKGIEFLPAGSALKFGRIAEGSADIYPRFGKSMEWDIAAGHIIAKESGKQLFIHNTKDELRYNKEDLTNPWFICE